MQNNNIGFIYKEAIDSTELEKIENGNMIDNLTLIQKNTNKRVKEEINYEAS